ncbi:MAG: undecaprenyl-phosphate glycosylphosphotransferase [Thermoleophilia bacterium]|nr:undecaprenyl-phosphate glycosylphosphotransferase [Thermoleophilia bacterium]
MLGPPQAEGPSCRCARGVTGSPRPTNALPASPTPAQPAADPDLRARLRLAPPATIDLAISARVARWSRRLHALITFAVAGIVMIPPGAGTGPMGHRIMAALVTGAVFLLAFRMERRNIAFARLSALARLVYRTRAVALGAFALGAVTYYVPGIYPGPGRVGLAALLMLGAGAIWGSLTRHLLGGHAVHRVLLVGDGERVGSFVSEFELDPHPEYEIVGMLTDTGENLREDVEGDTTLDEIIAMFDETTRSGVDARVLGTLDDLETVLASQAIDTVVVSVRRHRLELFSRLSAWGGDVSVQELPAFSEHVFGRVPVDVINAAWFMHLIHPFYRPYSRFVKRVGDLVAAICIGMIALPLLPLTALWIRLTSPTAPVIFRQERVGEGGRTFTLVKFRTMHPGGDGSWTVDNDPRIIRGGVFMRKSRIDELPNLWNILRGHMSFVGPRPEQPRYVAELEQAVPYYQRRHMVKPGLTGWAQVRQGYTDSVDGAAAKLGYELYYLKHQSLFLDFVIFVETIRVVLMRFGSR